MKTRRKEITDALVKTGRQLLRQINTGQFTQTLQVAVEQNPWFTFDQTRYMIESICNNYLDSQKLEQWLSRYPEKDHPQKNVGLTMAGNIPLVGFHDLLCVLVSGHKALVKMSSKDKLLLPEVLEILYGFDPEIRNLISFIPGRFDQFDAMIATGSNNSARYFEYYFGKYPHIIRRNRNSVAILDGKESDTELAALGEDIFRYYGMGCRSVSKIWIPEKYDFNKLFTQFESQSDVINHYKYANNYIYNKGIYSVNNDPFIDSGFLLLKENEQIASPLSVLHYQYYSGITEPHDEIKLETNDIQIVVAHSEVFQTAIPFGQSQQPQLWDYADHVDTMEFLQNL